MMEEEYANDCFFTNGARMVKLSDWLNWTLGITTTGKKWTVVLPMIQRGSVWKPHQIIDLWDTILRGMPFGGLMASHIPPSSNNIKNFFFHPLTRELVTLSQNGGISLIDGQQRTLAMLLAWPEVNQQMPHRIFVDFGESNKFDHLFSLHVTTESYPFGYQRGGNSGDPIARMSLSERRLAAAAYADRIEHFSRIENNFNRQSCLLHDKDVTPWNSTLALDLRKLIKYHIHNEKSISNYVKEEISSLKQNLMTRIQCIQDETQVPFSNYDRNLRKGIINHLKRRFDAINTLNQIDLNKRISLMEKSLTLLDKRYFPIIEVPNDLMETESTEDDDKDPSLAILFKRIGTGGTKLSTEDYIFSVIKHHNPNSHSLVEEQLSNEKIAAIFKPTALVMSAIRLTAAKLKLKDHPKLERIQFTRLLRGDKTNKETSNSFLSEFNKQISQEGEFTSTLHLTLDVISYKDTPTSDHRDIGLPKHALSLVKISALEIIIYWLQKNPDEKSKLLKNNRHQIIRFLILWNLCILDPAKASAACFEKLTQEPTIGSNIFPESELLKTLTTKKLALPVYSPSELQKIGHLTHSSSTVSGLRGWRRFIVSTDGLTTIERDYQQKAIDLYKRWWNLRNSHRHIFLLWLQRNYISKRFEKTIALPGLDEDKPYDFDHICPQSHWSYWTGKAIGNRLIDFPAEEGKDADREGHKYLGNAIGNIRIWCSSDNRSDGDAAPSIKLNLNITQEHIESRGEHLKDDLALILSDSAISNITDCNFTDETQAWKISSPQTKDPMFWTNERALAFQKAIELRTFNLYNRFYIDLKLSELQEKYDVK